MLRSEAVRDTAPTSRLEPGHVRLSLLGGFSLRAESGPISLPLGSQRLLAFLALESRSLLRSYVAGSLWMDSSERRSHASLRSALWRVRRPACPVVEADGTHVGIAGGVTVDVHEMLAASRGLRDGFDCPDVEETLFSADLLPDWYDDWVIVERERLRQVRLHALEALAERHMVARRYGRAVDAALAAVREEPLRESAQRMLIDIHLAEDNVIEAVRAYRRYESFVWQELRLQPSERLRRVMSPFVTTE